MHRPLHADGLFVVFGFLPTGTWLIYGTVSKEWRRVWLICHGAAISDAAHFGGTLGLVNLARSALLPAHPWQLHNCLQHAIVRAGNREAIMHMRAEFVSIADMCAHYDDLPLLQWARDQGFSMNKNVNLYAALHGNLPILEWLWGQDLLVRDEYSLEMAVRIGHLHILKWAWEHGLITLTPCIEIFAARSSNLEMLQWLYERGCRWHSSSSMDAAHAGQLEVLQWLRMHGCPWQPNICWAAEAHDHILRWIHESCAWDGVHCTYEGRHEWVMPELEDDDDALVDLAAHHNSLAE